MSLLLITLRLLTFMSVILFAFRVLILVRHITVHAVLCCPGCDPEPCAIEDELDDFNLAQRIQFDEFTQHLSRLISRVEELERHKIAKEFGKEMASRARDGIALFLIHYISVSKLDR